jgi:hypothetical protein
VNGFVGPLLSGLSYTAHLVGSALLGGAASVIGGGKFADGAVTGAFAYLMSPAPPNVGAHTDSPYDAMAMAERPRVGPLWLTIAQIFADVLSPTPAGDANDNGFPPLPAYTPGSKTIGLLVTRVGDFIFESGWGRPATDMPPGSPGYDIVTRTHVEGNAAAFMQQQGITNATLYINNPDICDSCAALLPRMLAPGSTLRVVIPSGNFVTFTGNRP